MSKLYLCSFASPDLKISVKKYLKEARSLNFYEKIKVFGINDLSKERVNQIKEFFKKGERRLYGFACWKPEIIMSFLNEIPEGAIVQYSDIGCSFNQNGINRLQEYVRIAEKNSILAFKYFRPNFNIIEDIKYQIYYEFEYTKKSVLDYFDVTKNQNILNTEQIWSGTIFFKNNIISKEIIKKWKDACSISKLINDDISDEINHKYFKEHRHDQSIFSIICKLRKIECLSASEIEWAEYKNKRVWFHLKEFPVLATRYKRFNFFRRFIERQKKNLNRLIYKK
tara:strand:- start:12374 stop:13219 length:846 start_codon:yes stop_codon:yes gene_type:complete